MTCDLWPALSVLYHTGGALLWNQVVWHWGSHANPRGVEPRFSVAFEFQALPTREQQGEPGEQGDAGAYQIASALGSTTTAAAATNDATTGGAVTSTGSAILEGTLKIAAQRARARSFAPLFARTLARQRVAERWGRLAEATDTDQFGDTVPQYNSPLSHPLALPSFEHRVQLIGKQILQYRHMYPLSAEMEALARRLAGDLPVPGYD